jgi:hypothetical protein
VIVVSAVLFCSVFSSCSSVNSGCCGGITAGLALWLELLLMVGVNSPCATCSSMGLSQGSLFLLVVFLVVRAPILRDSSQLYSGHSLDWYLVPVGLGTLYGFHFVWLCLCAFFRMMRCLLGHTSSRSSLHCLLPPLYFSLPASGYVECTAISCSLGIVSAVAYVICLFDSSVAIFCV